MITETGPVAARAGLRRSDVILSINGREMARSGDVVRALRDPGRRLAIELWRNGQRVALRFRL